LLFHLLKPFYLISLTCSPGPRAFFYVMASRNCLDSPDSYAIGWVAAVAIERAAAEAMLDEEHETPSGFTRQ